MKNLSQIKELINQLSFEEQEQLSEYLSECQNKHILDFQDIALEQVNSCPHCKSIKIIQWGNYKGTKRFMCKKCNRTFTPNTGSIFYHLKKSDEFIKYFTLMFSEDFNSLQSLSSRLCISKKTAFDWRHKILISLGSKSPNFKSITEMDGVWFLYSQKGRKGLKYSRKRGGSRRRGDNDFQAKVLITKERGGVSDMSLLKIGRLSKSDISRKLSQKFEPTSILVSDKHSSISSFAKSENIRHETFTAKNHVKDKLWHVQTVNNIASSLKTRINYWLRGVSTKYLQNYITWYAIRDKYKKSKEKVKNVITDSISNRKAWDMFTNIEKLYKDFILNHSVRTYRCPTKEQWKSQNWNLENAKLGIYL